MNQIDGLNKIINSIYQRLSSDKLVDLISAEDLKKRINLKLGEKESVDSWNQLIENYLQYSVNTSHPQFHNQLWSGFSYDSLVAELITNAMNTSMYTYEVAPVATLIEQEIIQTILNLIGYEDGEGIFTTGGTASNISALLAARNQFDVQISKEGLSNKQYKVFTSETSHYSYKKAMNITGLGIDNLVLVKSDKNGKMIFEDLVEQIQVCKDRGEIPLFIGATAGTTVQGNFDPIRLLGEFANKENIWLHVDGAFGGSFMFHDELKSKYLNGLDLADSFSFDAHKMMGISLICAMLFFKEKKNLYKAHDHGSGDDYIFRSENTHDLGPMSIQCGRKVDALKFFLYWKRVGNIGLKTRIEKLMDLANYSERKVLESEKLYMSCDREGISVCFRYKISSNKISEENFNVMIRDELHKKELALVNYGRVDGRNSIRLVLTNPEVKKEDLNILFENIENMGKELEEKLC